MCNSKHHHLLWHLPCWSTFEQTSKSQISCLTLQHPLTWWKAWSKVWSFPTNNSQWELNIHIHLLQLSHWCLNIQTQWTTSHTRTRTLKQNIFSTSLESIQLRLFISIKVLTLSSERRLLLPVVSPLEETRCSAAPRDPPRSVLLHQQVWVWECVRQEWGKGRGCVCQRACACITGGSASLSVSGCSLEDNGEGGLCRYEGCSLSL